MGITEFFVRWKDHSSTISTVCKDLLEDNFLVDCTIAAEGQCLKAHRLILSACSPYFQMMFRQDNEKHPIVFLKDTKFSELQAVIEFIYHGEVQISEDHLESFLHIAESLQIKGLNDAAQNNVRRQKVKQAVHDSNGASFSGCFSTSKSNSPTNTDLNYPGNDLYADNGSGVAQPTDSSENASPYPASYLPNVCQSSVKPNVTVKPLVKCDDPSDLKIKSPPATQQDSPPSTEELSSPMRQDFQSEQSFESIYMEPKCEPMDDTNDESVQDYPENDSQETNDLVNPENSEQNAAKPYPDPAPSFEDNSQHSAEHSYIPPGYPGNSTPEGEEGARLGHWGPLPPTRPHGARKLHACPECGKVFAARWQVDVHVRSHTGERPFACTLCGARFNQSGNLTVHMRRHTGERPFKCEVCGAAFSESNNLTRHIRLHTGEKPYACPDCPRRFTTSCQRSVHCRRHHPSPDLFNHPSA